MTSSTMQPKAAIKPKKRNPYPVDNDNLDLLEFLDRARRRESFSLPVLADWLDERDDPRGGGLRDLISGVITIPTSIARGHYVTVAEGPGWEITRSRIMLRMSISDGSRLRGLLGRDLLYSEQLKQGDLYLWNLHRIIERYRCKAVFALFGTSFHDIEKRSIIAHSLLDNADKRKLFRMYREAASTTIYGVSSAVRRRELVILSEEVMRADAEHMFDRFTQAREYYSDVE